MPAPYEADLSAQQPPPQAHARIPGAHADAFGTRRALGATPQRAQKTIGVNSGRVAGETFSRDDCLRKRREFEECYASGVRVPGRFLQLFLKLHAGTGSARLGISIPRRAGKAVVRNRLRRRIREIFRRNRSVLPPSRVDLVIQCRPGAADASFRELMEDYSESIRRARTRQAKP